MASNALAALAYGLRNAGGVLNKDVQTQLAQEQMQEDARADRRKDLITSLAIKAAQDGSANPAAVQATLAAQGIQVPSEFVGPSAETRARTAALENEQAFRAEWAKLAPDASLYA
jgi:translation initiation factor IF-2